MHFQFSKVYDKLRETFAGEDYTVTVERKNLS